MFHVDLSPFGVDVERLKSDRLTRLQGIMRARGLSALLLTDPLNIRYATNSVLWLNLRATGVQRFALAPADGEPVVYERLFGSERAAGLKKGGSIQGFGAYMFGMRPPVATEHFVDLVAEGLAEMGAKGERIGIDALCLTAVEQLRDKGFAPVDGLPALGESRVVKTQDEVELIRWTSRAKEGGYDLVRQAIRKPPVVEERLSRMMLEYLLEQGFEAGSEFISIFDSSRMAIRPHREPMGMDLVMTEGDLVICDATVAGPGGYYSDFARTFCHGTPSQADKDRYAEGYATLQEAMGLVRPGPCTPLFERFGKDSTSRLPGLDGFHGVGMCIYEAPWLRGFDPPEYNLTLEENMIIALEINHHPVKLEHLLRVTADGAEILSTYPMEPELAPA